MKLIAVAFAVSLASLAGCTERNPAFCCKDAADCAANDIPESQECSGGLVCRGNQCVAEQCMMASDCEASLPYCSPMQLCAATCTDSSECPGFGQDASDRFCMGGACVQCQADTDCPTASPVCDATNACRACVLDSECASGACGDDGACVAEASIVYVETTGLDAGTCTKQMPCKTLQFGVQNTLPTRSHIVMAAGTYVEIVNVDGTKTTSPTLTVHGGGASLEPPSGGELVNLFIDNVATTIRDLNFPDNGAFGAAIQSGSAPCTISNARVSSGGVIVGANMTIHDVEFADIKSTAIEVTSASHLLLDRVSIHGCRTGITTTGNNQPAGGVVSISNLLVFNTTAEALNLPNISGTIEFSTVADSGVGGTTPSAFSCSAGLTVQSSIVWTPGVPSIGGACAINSTIAGPIAVAGATNMDPSFVDETHNDFHLAPTSPAIDLVDTGPTTDLDGHPRPQGVRFDIGAYEATP